MGCFWGFRDSARQSHAARRTHPQYSAGSADAYGSMFGSVGLLVFAAVIWSLGTTAPAGLVLSLAMLAWIVTACGTWALVERLRRARRERANATARESPQCRCE